jgi:molybdenum cofactor cytidylyltransferase
MIGILLAAGFSRRFGAADKLLHTLPDGRPIAVAAAENLIKVIPLTIAVIRPDNQELADQLKNVGLKVVFCEAHETEMADSLSAAVRFAGQFNESSAGFVIALADMPYIKPHTIKAIAHALNAGAAIVAPVYQGKRGHPVGFSANLRNELERLTGDEGARSILKRHADQIKLLECSDCGILTDIDTPEDLITRPHM